MIYQFRKGFSIRNADAQTVGDELFRIRQANDGKLQAEAVVRAAAEPDSLIHDCFMWDTERAAHLYNLNEARTLIKSVVVVAGNAPPKPAYFNVTVQAAAPESDPAERVERYYQLSTEIAFDSPEYHSALNSALRELTSALMTVQQLWDMAPKGNRMLFQRVKGLIKSAREILSDMLPPKYIK